MRRFFSTGSRTLPLTIKQLLASPPTHQPTEVHGWIKSIRRQKNISFAVVTDGSSSKGLQAVFQGVKLPKGLTNGSSVRLNGTLSQSPGPGQDQELQVKSMEILGSCDPETYPIQKQSLSVEYLREQCHLRARTDPMGAMLRLRDGTTKALHTYFENQGFCYTHTPILTSSDCEGAGEVFQVITDVSESPEPSPPGFFPHPAYLTVSSQLHLEALATALSRVYTLSPCFRAETSQTNRHLAEFWMLEAEWAFTRSLDDVCDVVEDMAKTVLDRFVRTNDDNVDVLWKGGNETRRRALEKAADPGLKWHHLTYHEAMRALVEATQPFFYEPRWGRALQSEHEKWLTEHFVNGPVFVTDYPASLKPFYMRANDDEGQTVACFDLLVPHVGELAGGSLREERTEHLLDALQNHMLDAKDYGWYVDLRKYGGAPHGGFGMGFERLIGWLSGIENVRECVPMPRWAGRMLL